MAETNGSSSISTSNGTDAQHSHASNGHNPHHPPQHPSSSQSSSSHTTEDHPVAPPSPEEATSPSKLGVIRPLRTTDDNNNPSPQPQPPPAPVSGDTADSPQEWTDLTHAHHHPSNGHHPQLWKENGHHGLVTSVSVMPSMEAISPTYSEKMRRDARGQPISRGSKKHSIAFVDEVKQDCKVAEIHEVESFKEYNQEMYFQPRCGCCIQ
ncbi:unnamed protein product [Vitrella brassicaformis CCMP3155]|uniref:Uncharacterized protein n=1 Tax=Vitrella brassicaformis (strain CCMP3155) TaxID=1169540 RepID=A0A0G4EXN1_VITBC|nr:unnamed protein product [Vitrella brassicaformis CCMP3155]|mmetsp:Transcript_36224/g.90383  ORF Transcript_36224/g.90383 Transcript_36224/m.90383 type:complete len:209 (-) Transcript_36224:737-1363(-)|eukprot:CEM03583.1 unnamed protein product [Vitrella brassicaformis CCMP3155]